MIEKTMSMKQQDYQYTLIVIQLFYHILLYSKLFGSNAIHIFIEKCYVLAFDYVHSSTWKWVIVFQKIQIRGGWLTILSVYLSPVCGLYVNNLVVISKRRITNTHDPLSVLFTLWKWYKPKDSGHQVGLMCFLIF